MRVGGMNMDSQRQWDGKYHKIEYQNKEVEVQFIIMWTHVEGANYNKLERWSFEKKEIQQKTKTDANRLPGSSLYLVKSLSVWLVHSIWYEFQEGPHMNQIANSVIFMHTHTHTRAHVNWI